MARASERSEVELISVTLKMDRHVLPSEMKENVFDMFAVPVPMREVSAITAN
jgi:hypothetical protein